MVASSPSSLPSSPAQVLAQAAQDRAHPPTAQVVAALLDTERETKRQHLALSLEALLGVWHLRFTAPNKPAYKAGLPEGKGFYWPRLAPGTIAFRQPDPASDQLTIENQVQLGWFMLRFSGLAKFYAKKNLLAFDFTQVELWLGDQRLFSLPIRGRATPEGFQQTAIAKLPFFAFFAATEGYLAARGRGGGLALWAKSSQN